MAEANTRLSQIDAPQQAAIQAQEAAIQSLQAELDVATIDLARFQQLNQSGAVSRQELDRQQATVNRLRADLENAKATKQRLEQARATDMKKRYGPDGSHGSQCYAVPGAESGHFCRTKPG